MHTRPAVPLRVRLHKRHEFSIAQSCCSNQFALNDDKQQCAGLNFEVAACMCCSGQAQLALHIMSSFTTPHLCWSHLQGWEHHQQGQHPLCEHQRVWCKQGVHAW